MHTRVASVQPERHDDGRDDDERLQGVASLHRGGRHDTVTSHSLGALDRLRHTHTLPLHPALRPKSRAPIYKISYDNLAIILR